MDQADSLDLSLDLSLTKDDVNEGFSVLTLASLEDAAGNADQSISNERICKGDLILNTYRVDSDAISGGMGSVWCVRHLGWDTELAMKRPKARSFAEAGRQRKAAFVAECEHWINLGLHPHIVTCHYVREVGGVPTIFSEWMDGGSLRDAIDTRSLYEGTAAEVAERILGIAIQMARGLSYSHARKLLHQDVKPGNILLSSSWDAKVADFGLAQATSRLAGNNSGVAGHTLAYCPREQAEGYPAEPWMDTYAWALTVLEMYAGRRLWAQGQEAAGRCGDYCGACEVPVPAVVQGLLARCLTEHVDDLSEVEGALLEAYRTEVGTDYPRPEATAATDTADVLNNRALSFLDLGQPRIARGMLGQAERMDLGSYNPAFYNHWLMDRNLGQDTGEAMRHFGYSQKGYRHYHDPCYLLMYAETGNKAMAQQVLEDWNGRLPEAIAEHLPLIRRDFLDAPEVGFRAFPADVGCLLPSGNEVLLGHSPKESGGTASVELADTQTGEVIRTLEAPPQEHPLASIDRLCVSAQGTYAFALHGGVHMWRIADGAYLRFVPEPHDGGRVHYGCSFTSPDERFLFVDVSRQGMWVHDLETGHLYHAIPWGVDADLSTVYQLWDVEDDTLCLNRVDKVRETGRKAHKLRHIDGVEDAREQGFGHLPVPIPPDPSENPLDLPGSPGWTWVESNTVNGYGQILDANGVAIKTFDASRPSIDAAREQLLTCTREGVRLYRFEQFYQRFRAPYLLCRIRSQRAVQQERDVMREERARIGERLAECDVAGAIQALEQVRPLASDGHADEVACLSAQVGSVAAPKGLHSVIELTGANGYAATSDRKPSDNGALKLNGALRCGDRLYVLAKGRDEECGTVTELPHLEPDMLVRRREGIVYRESRTLEVYDAESRQLLSTVPVPAHTQRLFVLRDGKTALLMTEEPIRLVLEPEFVEESATCDFCIGNRSRETREVTFRRRNTIALARQHELYRVDVDAGICTLVGKGFSTVQSRSYRVFTGGELRFRGRFRFQRSVPRVKWRIVDERTGSEVSCENLPLRGRDGSYGVVMPMALSDDGMYLVMGSHLYALDWDWEPDAGNTAAMPVEALIDMDEYRAFARQNREVTLLGDRKATKKAARTLASPNSRVSGPSSASNPVAKQDPRAKKGFFSRLFGRDT